MFALTLSFGLTDWRAASDMERLSGTIVFFTDVSNLAHEITVTFRSVKRGDRS